ncbi:MAG TPA: APC family permease [Gemmatimonadaceae bacterium]|nr:APC family permease [Gemmatimonadaceae bacterium]
MTDPPQPHATESALVRAIGVRGLAAGIFNVTIGGGIFVLPAVVAGDLGSAAPIAYLVCAAVMGLIVLCFAEAGSRVSLTGGPYAYVEIAFGPYVGFLAGVLLWLLATFSMASVGTAFAGSVGALVPGLANRAAGAAVLALLFGALTWINVRGVKQGTRLIEFTSVAKLLPLILFVVAGAFFVDGDNLRIPELPGPGRVAEACIVLIFAFSGVESALVPSGEVRDPARVVPRAIALAMTLVTVMYLGIHVVAQGVLGPELAQHAAAPLADASRVFLGEAGRLVLLFAAIIAMFGYASGMTLAVPRALFAFGRDGILPSAVAAVHPRFRTPHVAIVIQSIVVVLLAATGTFRRLAVFANVSALLCYLICCVAAWELRRRDIRAGGATPFRVPGGALVPVLASAVIVWLLVAGTPPRVFLLVGLALALATVLFVLARPHRRSPAAEGA